MSARRIGGWRRCDLLVHHGGAGTTAAAAEAAVPTLVCPVWADQPFWARQSERLRIGTVAREGGRALSPCELDAATLASLLRRALAQAEEHADARAAVRSALAAEACGLDVACRVLTPLLRPPEDHEPPPKRARCV